MSSDAPSFTEPKDVVPVRKFALEWLGYYSFVLCLSKEERKMLTPREIANHERRHQEFRDTYTTPSLHQLHHDIYMALKRLLGKFIMMYASLRGSTKDTYYSAFMRLNESLTRSTSTFDVATVRAAAVLAFNAENRRLKMTPPDSTPASVLGFAAAVGPRRSSTVSGSHTAGPGCCKCPIHCKLPDGTFRVVRARETDAAADFGTAATAPTSSESRHALRIYNAAIDDFDTPTAAIAFLRSIYETERQADFDCANPSAYAAFTGAAYIDFSDQD
jgi:hypothetical protein